MKYLFLILVGCAVNCEDVSNNYFVVEMRDDPPQPGLKALKKNFQVYWNVPTMQCNSKKIPFTNLYEKFGIIQNNNDRFIGEKITILYEPGDFPAIFKNESSGKYRLRNGGVPQEGNLEKHLTAFKSDLNFSIPDPNFNGIGIIDFESWRPVFRQNFGILVPYKDVSIEIEKQLHWWWPKTMVQAEATRRFEAAARRFMQTTLSIAKQMRPRALWGYYGFPHCFNMASNNMKESCARNVPEENNGIYWLWSESTALFPSIYSSASLSSSQLSSLINGRVQESVRLRVRNTPVLPYFWFRYRDAGFMSQGDLSVALSTLYKSKASGFIIWGSSNDVNTVDKCNKLYNYVETILGPNIAKYTKQINKINDEIDNEGNTTTLEPSTNQILNETIENSTVSTRMGQMDPEFDWVPPKNYSEDISKQVDEELTRKGYNKTVNEYKDLNQGIVMDLIFDALINAQSNMGNKNIRETEKNNKNTGTTEGLKSINISNSMETLVYDGITNLNKEITTTEFSTIYTEGSTENSKITQITDAFTDDQSTETYDKTETYETTENNKNLDTTEIENILTSKEEKRDFLIEVVKPKRIDLNDSVIENETERDLREETTEVNEREMTSQMNEENVYFKESSDSEQVTYVYNK